MRPSEAGRGAGRPPSVPSLFAATNFTFTRSIGWKISDPSYAAKPSEQIDLPIPLPRRATEINSQAGIPWECDLPGSRLVPAIAKARAMLLTKNEYGTNTLPMTRNRGVSGLAAGTEIGARLFPPEGSEDSHMSEHETSVSGRQMVSAAGVAAVAASSRSARATPVGNTAQPLTDPKTKYPKPPFPPPPR